MAVSTLHAIFAVAELLVDTCFSAWKR